MIHVIISILGVNEYSLKPGCSSTTTHSSVMNVWFQIVSIQFHPNLSQLQMDSVNSSQTNTHHFHLLIIPTYHSHYSKNTYSATETWFTRKTSFHQSWTIVSNKCLFLLFLQTHSIQINKTTTNLSRRCLHTHTISVERNRDECLFSV